MEFKIILAEQTPAAFPVGDIDAWLKERKDTIKEFLEFAKSHNSAVGLAANQVSIDGERFLSKCFAKKNLETGEWDLIVNPYIDAYIGMKELKEEGCLTWPNKTIVAERNRAVRISYYDSNGERHEKTVQGFEGQIWQHEINHLNGIEERVEELTFMLPRQKEPERNEKCFCGSNLKYKLCCLKLI